MLLNAILAFAYIFMGTFSSLLTFIGITEYLIFIFTVLALLRLRSNAAKALSPSSNAKHTNASGYRTRMLNPIVFCSLSTFLVARGIALEPLQGAALLSMLASLGIFWRWKHGK
jgi:hypothetical protein